MRLFRPLTALRRFGHRLMRDSRGGSAIEYGLILALIVLAMFAALMTLADVTKGMWNDMDVKVRAASAQ